MTMVKLAATSMVFGVAIVGCSPVGQAMHVGTASDSQAIKTAASAAKHATRAIGKQQFAKAVGFAEAAVAAQPRDAGYRMLLGQVYLRAGRFQSAETSFSDALRLDPERERAALNLALAQTALGKTGEALRTLGEYRDKLPAADYGLASALAGDLTGAITALEFAARGPQADAKTRQNLALAYALAGKWANAKVLAVQDLDPQAADARLAEWARLVNPAAAWDQVAAVLGVKPVADSGQPVQLALAPAAPSAVQLAQAEPVAVPDPVAPLPFEVETVSEAVAVAAYAAPKPVFEVPVAAPAVIRADPIPYKQAVVQPAIADRALAAVPAAPFKRPVGTLGGSYVVQLGAFENAGVAKNSWTQLSNRFGLAAYDPVNSRMRVRNVSFVRLAVGGFATRAEAMDICNRIKASGGACFVRATAGDAPVRWVQRGLPRVASR